MLPVRAGPSSNLAYWLIRKSAPGSAAEVCCILSDAIGLGAMVTVLYIESIQRYAEVPPFFAPGTAENLDGRMVEAAG